MFYFINELSTSLRGFYDLATLPHLFSQTDLTKSEKLACTVALSNFCIIFVCMITFLCSLIVHIQLDTPGEPSNAVYLSERSERKLARGCRRPDSFHSCK